jgi:hypothetical protein
MLPLSKAVNPLFPGHRIGEGVLLLRMLINHSHEAMDNKDVFDCFISVKPKVKYRLEESN